MTFTVAKKIWGNLLLGVSGILLMFAVSHFSVEHLRKLQDTGADRFRAAIRITEGSLMGAKAYQIIADAIINRNLEGTRVDWPKMRQEMEEDGIAIDGLADTPQQHEWASKGNMASKELIKIFEGQVLPLLSSPEADSSWEAIRSLDDKMDEQKKIIQDNYTKMAESISSESIENDKIFDDTGDRADNNVIILAIVTIIVMLTLGGLVIKSITIPINKSVLAMERLANNDTSVEVPGCNRQDELGAIARTVQVFKENAIKKLQMESQAEDMKRQAEEQRRQEMNKLASEFESQVSGIVNGVTTAAKEMEGTAQTMTSLATQVSSQAMAVASASEEAASNVETVAAASEELSSSVNEISRQVSESSRISREAVEEAAQTDTIVRGLAETVGRIGDVVKLINDIATQTNLLALNATIEAARAGEAGKGFAVVANEVKNLANQTAKATDEITSQISAVQTETARATEAISSIAGIVNRVDQITGSIAASVEEQSAATHEIARNVEQAARGTHEVSNNIAGVTSAADRSGDASRSVLTAARQLNNQSETLNHAVSGFISRIRS